MRVCLCCCRWNGCCDYYPT
uniref:Uncharacterized protein n=1 Tax=Anguilla anguilla TaxID=7936 RepID=A0A0E9W448_ANGAN